MFGDLLSASELRVKYNSANQFTIKFWDDAANTLPSDLTGAVVAIEVTTAAGVVTWTGTNLGNTVTWNLTQAESLLTWRSNPYRMTYTKTGVTRTVLTGLAVVQS